MKDDQRHWKLAERPLSDLPNAVVPKASTVLAAEIRRRVLANAMPVGADLPSESQLIEQSGLSRATVRESLRLLESEGLVSIKRGVNGGVKVAHPDSSHVTHSLATMLALSEATISDLFRFRLTLEPAAAGIAAVAATEEQRDQLRQMASLDSNHVAHNVDFHIALATATNNEFFRVTLNAVHELTEWHSSDEGLAHAQLDAAVGAHRRIAEHICRGNAAGAERATRRHIEIFEQVMADRDRLNTPVMRNSRVGSWM